MNRRYFLTAAAGTLAAARVRAVPPSDRIGIGVIGVGSRGRAILGELANVSGVEPSVVSSK